MLKLTKVTFDRTPRIPGLRAGDFSELDCDNPAAKLKDWRIVIKGASLFLISPPGWSNSETRIKDPAGPVTVHEVPRANASLHWSGSLKDIEEMVKSNAKWETPPLGWKPAPPPGTVVLETVPPGEMGDA